MFFGSSLLFLLFFLSTFILTATQLDFDYPTFDQGRSGDCPPGTKTICLQGDAFIIGNERLIHLTTNQVDRALNDSVGRAVYSEPLHLWNNSTGDVTSFTTEFSFVIDNLGKDSYGDGLAFFLGHFPSAIPPDSTGRDFGLMTDSVNKTEVPVVTSADEAFVAVEFDSFKNFYDFSSRHVGIDVNTIDSLYYFNLSIHFEGNATGVAQVDFDGATQNFTVALRYAGERYGMSHVVRLREILPEWVSVGFSATTGEQFELHKLISWKFKSTLDGINGASTPTTTPAPVMGRSNGNKVGLVVGISVGVVLLISVLVGLALFTLRKRLGGGNEGRTSSEEDNDPTIDEELGDGRAPRRFPYKELVAATGGFAEGRKLGVGGFGAVYRGLLKDTITEVAVKRVSKESKQGRREYMSEVKIISRLRHRNLVQLVGWCHAHGELILVYEFMPNGSLDYHLFHEGAFLPWPARYKIAVGIASALLYLHEEWEQCVLHRDIKSSNVMLDAAFNAKLGDFGLARLVDHGERLHTTGLAGTMSYMAPESFVTGKASKETDVYSFGVVALEIACGRRAIEPREDDEEERLVEWVWKLYGRGTVVAAADESLDRVFDEGQMERLMVLGLWCAHPDHRLRPSIRQVVGALNFEAPLPVLPPSMPVPTYSAVPLTGNLHGQSSGGLSSSSTATTSVNSGDRFSGVMGVSSSTSVTSTSSDCYVTTMSSPAMVSSTAALLRSFDSKTFYQQSTPMIPGGATI